VPPGAAAGGVGIGSLGQLPAPVAEVVRASYGDATALVFLIATILSVVSVVTVALIREVPLRTRVGDDQVKVEAPVAR
jgi:hypothetical protein